MNNAWHLGKLAGIDIKVHWTFLLLPAWVLFSTLFSGGTIAAATATITLVLIVFGCVVLHELGHALAARKFGIGTKDIVLLPIGGVASLERIPKNPFQELMIALAGPAVNVVIAAALFAVMAISPLTGVAGWLVSQVALINVGLVVFNMIPAFPMDGGRVLRSTLAMFISHHRATQVATTVGKVAAIGLGFLGIVSGQLMLLLIAGFVFLAASGEAIRNKLDAAGGFAEQDGLIYTSDVRTSTNQHRRLPMISADWNAASALQWLSRRAAGQFPVVKDGCVIGFATFADLQRAVAAGRGRWSLERVLSVKFT